MPIYHIGCGKCGAEQDIYRTVSQYDDLPDCCGEKMSRLVTAPYVIGDIQPYRSMITGELITSRSRHAEHLREHNCVEIGNETKYLTPKTEIDLSAESKQRRKEEIIRQVNAIS
jgi:hypothetical protein